MPGTTRHRITIDQPLESDFLSDILITAFDGGYGGCWYWCEPAMPAHQGGWLTVNEAKEWQSVTILETGDGDVSVAHVVDWEVVAKGLQWVVDKATTGNHLPTTLSAVLSGDAGDIDATAADMIVQMGLFDGEVRYG